MALKLFRRHRSAPGASPGTIEPPSVHVEPRIHVISFDADGIEEHDCADAREAAALRRPGRIAWIDVQGLGDGSVVEELGGLLELHALAVSDVVHVGQRPKADDYERFLFVVLRMVLLEEDELTWEQFSLFLGSDFVVTFQETHGDCLDSVRDRLRRGRKRIRSSRGDYLACQILDAIVDAYFPVLEFYGDWLEDLEERVLERPDVELLTELYQVKRDLVTLRRATWPLRDALQHVLRQEDGLLGKTALPYLRDTIDHVMQVVDVSENYRELSTSLVDVYLSMIGQKTNEIMRVLTVIATIFIPLTFVAGVYGMNFDTSLPGNLPELSWRYGYLAFWGVCLGLGITLLYAFRRLGWLGRPKT